jgi:hypothetical protein
VHEKDVVGTKRTIDKKFATPVAVGVLQTHQILLGAADGGVESILGGACRGFGKYHGISLSERGLRMQTETFNLINESEIHMKQNR